MDLIGFTDEFQCRFIFLTCKMLLIKIFLLFETKILWEEFNYVLTHWNATFDLKMKCRVWPFICELCCYNLAVYILFCGAVCFAYCSNGIYGAEHSWFCYGVSNTLNLWFKSLLTTLLITIQLKSIEQQFPTVLFKPRNVL